MEGIRQYALSLICAALIVGILQDISEKTGFSKQFRLVGSIFLTGILISPLVSLRLRSLPQLDFQYQLQAEEAAAQGQEIRIRSLSAIIREECEAYILKEARAIGADVEVQIELNAEYPPAPSAVTVQGCFYANAEMQLSGLLADELGIPKEHQTWIRQQSHSFDNSSKNTNIVS